MVVDFRGPMTIAEYSTYDEQTVAYITGLKSGNIIYDIEYEVLSLTNAACNVTSQLRFVDSSGRNNSYPVSEIFEDPFNTTGNHIFRVSVNVPEGATNISIEVKFISYDPITINAIRGIKGGSTYMAMNVNNLVIDRILRGVMFSTTTREALWSVSQISNFSISVTTDSQDAVDATGTPIMTFYRAKNCEVTAENALWDLGLFAAQGGGDQALMSSSATNKFSVPIFDEIELASATSATLSHTPILPTGETYAVPYIYVLNGDGTLGKKLECAGTAGAGKYTQSGTAITFSSGELAAGDTIVAFYDYEANGTSGSQAVKLQNTAKDFPKAGKFVLEILACDPCDKSTLYYAYLIMPSATLAPDVDLDFATDATHSFTLRAQQDYCDKTKLLYAMVIPESV